MASRKLGLEKTSDKGEGLHTLDEVLHYTKELLTLREQEDTNMAMFFMGTS
jgi:hypothetical protein